MGRGGLCGLVHSWAQKAHGMATYLWEFQHRNRAENLWTHFCKHSSAAPGWDLGRQ